MMDAEGRHRVSMPPTGRTDPFSTWVVPEVPALFKVALSLAPNRDEAEDLVQETLLRAFRAIDTFDGAHPRAWLFTIARNTNATRFRRRRFEPMGGSDEVEEQADHRVTDPADVTESSDLRSAVNSAMATLSRERRQVMQLVDLDGLSYAEAAAAIGVPIGTVMSRLHRARRTVRNDLIRAGLAPTKGTRR